MPEDGLKLCNVAVLADEGRRLDIAVPVARLPRIARQLASPEGMVTGSVALSREMNHIIADVSFEADVTLLCQRCLEPMPVRFAGNSRVALLESEAAAADVPPELETALAPEGRIAPAELVEDELILALPVVAVSPDAEVVEREFVPTVEETAQANPFAALAGLKKK
jgi:uncharacterized protein